LPYQWPKFRKRRVSPREVDVVNLPEPTRGSVLADGVVTGFGCKADQRLSELVVDGRAFVRFAAAGRFGAFCIDPFTGFVVHVVLPPGKGPTHATFVNTSIIHFNRTVEAFLRTVSHQRVVDDDDDDNGAADPCDELASDVRRAIEAIESAAVELGRYWDEEVASVQMGNYRPAVMAWAKRSRRNLRPSRY
jgi:hypothetical protein